MHESGGAVLDTFKCVDKKYLVWVPDGACVLKFRQNKGYTLVPAGRPKSSDKIARLTTHA